MKKYIAALIIAAGMMIAPSTSKAYAYFDVYQILDVRSNTWNLIAYRYGGGSWTLTGWHLGDWRFEFPLSDNDIDTWVYDWSAGYYRDNTYILNDYQG